MKAISLKQPWANLVANGKKTIETRTWPTKHRGNLLIVSSKRPNTPPAGYAVAIVRVIDCRPMTIADKNAACCKIHPKAWAWILEDIRPITPFPVKGSLGICEAALPNSVIESQLHTTLHRHQKQGYVSYSARPEKQSLHPGSYSSQQYHNKQLHERDQ